MKFIFKIVFTVSVFIFASCKQDSEKPKVSYNKPKNVVEQKQDTTKIAIAGLPIQFENTNYWKFEC
jgi:PBP1b-binding outer membrane lipoprotein LpoB